MKSKTDSRMMSDGCPTHSSTSIAEQDDIADRLALRRDILDLISRRRAKEGDPNIGASVERRILRSPVRAEEAGSRQ